MQNSIGMFTFFVFNRKYPVWDNLFQKIKIVNLRWNLIPRLIRICRIQWYCSLSFVFEWKYLYCANLVQKVTIISWSWNLVPRLIRICWNQWCCSLFSFLTRNSLLGQIWSKLLYLQFFFCFRSEMSFFGKMWS